MENYEIMMINVLSLMRGYKFIVDEGTKKELEETHKKFDCLRSMGL
jgi:hypothetical protein